MPPEGAEISSLQLAARLSEIARVDPWWAAVAGDAGMPADVAQELLVCLHELVGNAIMHGGPGVRQVSVEASRIVGRIALTVVDDGMAFDPTTVPEPVRPASLEEARIGGLGLVLVRRFAEELHYERANGCNRVTVSRHFTAVGSPNSRNSGPMDTPAPDIL